MKFTIHKSINIHATPQRIFHTIGNLEEWNRWSPWIQMESDVKTTISGTPKSIGQKLMWEGEIVGSGTMEIVKLVEDQNIELSLNFFKPHANIARAIFEIEVINHNECKIHWTMHGNIPFFFIFFLKTMKSYIGHDFIKGLKLLKDLIEKGEVYSSSKNNGIQYREGFYYVGIQNQCSFQNLSASMSEDFNQLYELVNIGVLPKPEGAMSFTLNYNLTKEISKHICALRYSSPIENQNRNELKNFQWGNIPNHQCLSVHFQGPYRHLGNPWGMALAFLRHKKLKFNKLIPMYENYLTNPHQTASENFYETEICIPLKS